MSFSFESGSEMKTSTTTTDNYTIVYTPQKDPGTSGEEDTILVNYTTLQGE
jgi:hypothetical protein